MQELIKAPKGYKYKVIDEQTVELVKKEKLENFCVCCESLQDKCDLLYKLYVLGFKDYISTNVHRTNQLNVIVCRGHMNIHSGDSTRTDGYPTLTIEEAFEELGE